MAEADEDAATDDDGEREKDGDTVSRKDALAVGVTLSVPIPATLMLPAIDGDWELEVDTEPTSTGETVCLTVRVPEIEGE